MTLFSTNTWINHASPLRAASVVFKHYFKCLINRFIQPLAECSLRCLASQLCSSAIYRHKTIMELTALTDQPKAARAEYPTGSAR
ncbi:MAG: hypothetical protein AB1Y25_03220 [Cycloclasticus sp.]